MTSLGCNIDNNAFYSADGETLAVPKNCTKQALTVTETCVITDGVIRKLRAAEEAKYFAVATELIRAYWRTLLYFANVLSTLVKYYKGQKLLQTSLFSGRDSKLFDKLRWNRTKQLASYHVSCVMYK